ncbi:MAG: esterase family protein [Cyclobacteriaceae bacterium]|nr:esterase family protein [Cyclobacteriaceae bacterium]
MKNPYPLCLITTFLLFLVTLTQAQDPLPQVVSGRIERIANFQSRYVTARNVDVWLPEGYSSGKRYSVLYMHDGQMLFDSTVTWNKQSWDVDELAARLMKSAQVPGFIVVGVWNGGATRFPDYFPQRPFEMLTKTERDTLVASLQKMGRTQEVFQPKSDDYLRFLVEELKPYIDMTYAVHKDASHTFVAGSSMGGLISMYAICEYPKVFGGAACLSTHWPGSFSLNNNPVPDAFVNYLRKHLPKPASHRIYFDCGDQTLDALYPAIQRRADEVMREAGFTEANWITRYFPGADHSERAWKRRLEIPLLFLLK